MPARTTVCEEVGVLDVPDTQPLPRLIEELRGFSLKQNADGAAHSVDEPWEDHGGEETREEDSSVVELWSADSGDGSIYSQPIRLSAIESSSSDGGEDNRLPMSPGRREKGRRLVQVLSSQDTSSSEEAAPAPAGAHPHFNVHIDEFRRKPSVVTWILCWSCSD